jgi:hypothetical protein
MNITDTVLIAAIKGLIPGLLVGAVILITASQCGPPPQTIAGDPAPAGGKIIRQEYPEDGVVCYIYLRDLECVKK